MGIGIGGFGPILAELKTEGKSSGSAPSRPTGSADSIERQLETRRRNTLERLEEIAEKLAKALPPRAHTPGNVR